jgi:ankyrin repeat protein
MSADMDCDCSAASADLQEALRDGDPQRVRDLIEAGADIRYQGAKGYDALIDAVHGRDVADDPRLLDLLAVLVAYGAPLDGESDYSETGLRVLSRLGRFDAVRLLLDAGANRDRLGWGRLHEAVALGSLADVHAALTAGEPLEGRDFWFRTPWLIALQIGDLAKAQLLRDWGADLQARGHCDYPSLFYPIWGRHLDIVRWLLREGADVHLTDQFDTTALVEAVRVDDLACVDLLLEAGADVQATPRNPIVEYAQSREMMQRLLEAGADLAQLGCAEQRVLLGLPRSWDCALAAVSADDYRQGATRVFGRTNPERMPFPYWQDMIRAGKSAYSGRQHAGGMDPTAAGPGWSADRFGQSLTLLPDGRAIQIAGEHEDFYDPDFCIYNDVFVHQPGGSIDIFGYPRSDFPPTDFHTATLAGDAIYVIGSLGYQGTRQYGKTPVYRLDLMTFRIDRLDTTGDCPGWIFKHRAAVVGPATVRVWGGTVVTETGGKEFHDLNPDVFMLNLADCRWQREPAGGSEG